MGRELIVKWALGEIRTVIYLSKDTIWVHWLCLDTFRSGSIIRKGVKCC